MGQKLLSSKESYRLFLIEMARKTKSKKNLISAGAARRTFKKFSWRGVDLANLFDLTNEQLMKLLHARARRRFTHRGLSRKPMALMRNSAKRKKPLLSTARNRKLLKHICATPLLCRDDWFRCWCLQWQIIHRRRSET